MPGAKARIRLDGADPINRGLVGFWPLTDGAGTRARNVVASQAAALVSSPAWTAQGLILASGSYVEAPTNAAYDFVRGGSVSLWVRGAYASQITYGNLFSKSSGGVTEWSLFREIATGALSLYSAAAAGQVTFAGSLFQEMMDGRLNHVCYTQNGTTASIFINGRVRDSKTITAPTYQALPLRFGNDANATGYINGQIQNVRFFRRALAPGEVARLARDPWAGTARTRSPIAYTVPALNADIAGTVPIAGNLTASLNMAAAMAGTVPLSGSLAATLDATPDAGDTHDGFIRRSRRQRALDAAERRRRDEAAQEAIALRLGLEAAMGMAAEAVEDVPEAVSERVEQAVQQAARYVPRLVAAPDAGVLQAANDAIVALRAAVAAADRARMLAEDDDDVMALLRAL